MKNMLLIVSLAVSLVMTGMTVSDRSISIEASTFDRKASAHSNVLLRLAVLRTRKNNNNRIQITISSIRKQN